MSGKPLIPKGSAPPLAPYSPGFKAGNVIATAGAVALDAGGNLIGAGDAGAQTRAVLEAIKNTLKAGGASLADVIQCHIFLTNMGDYRAMNAVYAEYFKNNPPARWCVRADLVRPEFLVEIAALAVVTAKSKSTSKSKTKSKSKRRR